MKFWQESWYGLLMVVVISCWSSFVYAAPVGDVIAAAKKEGVIEFYAPASLTPNGAQALTEAVNKKYGLNIKMIYSSSGNMASDVGQVVGSAASGIPPEWDMMVLTDGHHSTLWGKKLHQLYDYRTLGVDPRAIQYDGGTVSFSNQIVLPVYNKKLVQAKDVPKRWEDLLDPKWKGKLGMSSTTHHLARLAAGPWGEEKTTNFVKALTKQDLMLGRMAEIYNRLLLGEVLVAVSLTDSQLKAERNKDAPIVFAEKVSPVVLPSHQVGVLKGAKHPNLGYLIAAFLTTPEGQKIWAKYNGTTSVLIPGTPAYKFTQGKKLVIMTQDQAAMVDRLSLEYAKILGFSGI